jgi:hypothetical protein
MRSFTAGGALLLALATALPAVAQQPADQDFNVRVTITSSQASRDGFGYIAVLRGYVDGTPAALKCELCPALPAGQYKGRWDKDKMRIRWTEAFGDRKVRENRFEISLSGPKRDTGWSRGAPVLITPYGESERQCMEPIQLAYNVITKIEHPANWRIVMACTPASWEKASLEFHTLGGTRIAFTLWDSPTIPGGGTVLTVLNGEQFDRCMRPGCYVHTILHELGHFRRVTADEAVAEEFVAEQEAALYREHPPTDFPSNEDVMKCLSSRDAACPITGEIGQLVQTARTSLQSRAAAGAPRAGTLSPDLDPRHYPIAITLLDAQWQTNGAGGVAGSGRADLVVGTSTTAFEFTSVCPDRLETIAARNFYRARWEAEPTRLTVLADGNPQRVFTCELKGVVHPGQVYVLANGTVGAVTEEQFKARAAVSKTPTGTGVPSAGKPQLTNSDVISMVALNLSAQVILAKISASDCRFDTSPTGLQQLKAAHVPDEIVLKMIERGSR